MQRVQRILDRRRGWKRWGAVLPWLTIAVLIAAAVIAVALAAAASSHTAPSCSGKRATITGSPGPDRLVGTPGPDVIAGLGGADRIVGGGGDDLICGGPGDDVIHAGAGVDLIFGEAGSDRLFGEKGDDRLFGGAAYDRCLGGEGSDRLVSCEHTGKGNRGPAASVGGPPPDNPLYAGDVTASTSEDVAKTIDVLSNSSDPEGHPLKVVSLDTTGTRGAVEIVSGGDAVRYDPVARFKALAAAETATDRFAFTIIDDRGGTASATATITVDGVDDPPAAVDDGVSLMENAGATAIDVRANDTDVDGGPKTVTSVTQPAHGSAAVSDGGLEITYEPDSGYCNDDEAADKFSYSLNGGSSAEVEVEVACTTAIAVGGGLSPAFDSAVPDYTVHCDGSPLAITGRTALGAEVMVDGQPAQTGSFQTTVPLEQNQEFEFSVVEGIQQSHYYVRCLPEDFPIWEYERLRQPGHQFYVVTPTLSLSGGAAPYLVIFDENGVPVWWHSDSPAPASDGKVLANGDIAYWGSPPGGDAYEIRNLEGTLLQAVRPVTGRIDSHEFQVEPNGDYLITSYRPREHVDLTEFGGGSDDTVVDGVIEEVTPSGELKWEWSTQGHIGLAETGRWWPTALASPERDIVHMNAVEPVGDDAVLISLRHTDAVYKIDKATGNVIWKLGGTWTPKSLTVKDDPEGAYPLGGQHDVRLLADGTITIHDNNTNLPDPPRAVRYAIDESAKTATLVEAVTDPEVSTSICCGSARRSADGSWLMSWGGNSLVTEFDAEGRRTFQLGFGAAAFSYRAVAAPDSVLTRGALRAGMDAMHPRP